MSRFSRHKSRLGHLAASLAALVLAGGLIVGAGELAGRDVRSLVPRQLVAASQPGLDQFPQVVAELQSACVGLGERGVRDCGFDLLAVYRDPEHGVLIVSIVMHGVLPSGEYKAVVGSYHLDPTSGEITGFE